MGASGVVMFVMIYAAGGVKPGDPYAIPHAIHSLIANLVWAYWWGHIAMALLHASRTPRILRIFIP
jgi:cytochrome b561